MSVTVDVNTVVVDVIVSTTPLDIVALDIIELGGPQGPQGEKGNTGPQGLPGQWTQLTQAEYDALNPPDPNTLYVVVG